jgi:Flp pilus assembly protein TadG
MFKRRTKNSESGIATIEFAVVSGFFLLMIVGVVAGGHFFWTHNALVEATRRGARYAASQCSPTDTACPNRDTVVTRIKNVVIYGTPTPTDATARFVPDLQPAQVAISYSPRAGMGDSESFGIAQGTVSVKILSYNYNFALSPVTLSMPPYETTVRGESAGYTASQYLCSAP